MISSQESGFSLLEMLAVLSIFMILSVISVVSWQASAPVMQLNAAANALGGSLELALKQSATQHSEYFLLFTYDHARQYATVDGATFHMPTNSYTLVNDDGWYGHGLRQYHTYTKSGSDRNEFAPIWFPEDSISDAATHHRHNNLIEQNEIYKGPIKLGSGIVFVTPAVAANRVNRLVFSYMTPKMYWESAAAINDPIKSDFRRTEDAKIFLANQKYKFGINTKDNMAHLRLIRVTDFSVRVLRPSSLS